MPEQVSSSDFKRRWLPALGLVAAGVVLVGGWFLYSETRTSSPAAAASVPVPAVGVRPVVKKGVSESFEFVGHIKAVDKVDLRARVEGFLEKRLFVEGQFVKAGDLLYQIEKVQYEALVDQAKANLNQAEANLNYTKIVSPVDGVVIDKKIEPGQTVAGSQFQTPELFVVVPNMDKEIYVVAAVDEADIALIELAKRSNQPVHFTVDSSPDDLFEGKIVQIRMDSTTTQNVVTYPVVVSAPNPDLKLKPGMTASVTFQVRSTQDVLRIPNAALRYFPPRDLVRLEDRAIIENKIATVEADESTATRRSAEEKAELRRKRNRRHVWVVDGDKLRAVEVVVGLSNNQHTELVSGDLQEGDKLVTGIQAK